MNKITCMLAYVSGQDLPVFWIDLAIKGRYGLYFDDQPTSDHASLLKALDQGIETIGKPIESYTLTLR